MSDALSFATQKITLKEEFEQGGILTVRIFFLGCSFLP
jgi:hypothetical protein